MEGRMEGGEEDRAMEGGEEDRAMEGGEEDRGMEGGEEDRARTNGEGRKVRGSTWAGTDEWHGRARTNGGEGGQERKREYMGGHGRMEGREGRKIR